MRTDIAAVLLVPALAGLLYAETLRLRVLDPQNAAVPQARIFARQAGRSAAVLTDSAGAAVLNLAPPVNVEVQAPGFDQIGRASCRERV